MTIAGKGGPGLAHTFSEPLQTELKKIWRFLKGLVISPRWRLYDRSESDGMFVQVNDPKTRTYKSVVRFNPSTQAVTYRNDSSVTDRLTLEARAAAVPQNALVTISSWDYVVIPVACTLAGVSFTARVIAGASPQADCYLWRSGVDQGTVLSGLVTLANPYRWVSGTVSTTSLNAGDVLQMRFATDAGEVLTSVVMNVYCTKTTTTTGFSTDYDNIGVI